MDKLIKSSTGSLTGAEKAAIFMSEIGPFFNENYEAFEKSLNLSPQEMRKIRKAMKKMGNYNPIRKGTEGGIAEIQREAKVLEEALMYGRRKGIFNPEERKLNEKQSMLNKLTKNAAGLAQNNPEEMAKVLASWLNED